MTKIVSTLLAQSAKAYVSEQLRLDPRAGTAMGDEFWIDLAKRLIRQSPTRASSNAELKRV